jgi:hypothetical protein
MATSIRVKRRFDPLSLYGSDLGIPEVGVIKLDAILGQDSHPVAHPHSQLGQGAGRPAGPLIHLPEGQLSIPINDPDAVGRQFRPFRQKSSDVQFHDAPPFPPARLTEFA